MGRAELSHVHVAYAHLMESQSISIFKHKSVSSESLSRAFTDVCKMRLRFKAVALLTGLPTYLAYRSTDQPITSIRLNCYNVQRSHLAHTTYHKSNRMENQKDEPVAYYVRQLKDLRTKLNFCTDFQGLRDGSIRWGATG